MIRSKHLVLIRSKLVVAGLCDGERERAYAVFDPILGGKNLNYLI